MMSGFDDETGYVEVISIPSRLRPSVLGCIEVLYTEMIMGHESRTYKETLKKQLDEFKLLIQMNWEWETSSNAEKNRKSNLLTKETVMPLDEDIKTIKEKINELEKRY
ncbi:hypothetical protein O0L34_g11966 [Tuta absoluta]|nr:hypothetical protein O0L34_g11966 [Tuta absoluta]